MRYIRDLLKGDLGISYATKKPVTEMIAERLPTTLTLAFVSVLLAGVIGVVLGVISATKQYTWVDSFASIFSLIGVAMPNFWLGLVLILLFSVKLGWLPATGFYGPSYWVLPAITIGYSLSATITRQTRSSMLETIRQDYLRTARAKGQKEIKVIVNHALKNALIPIVTVLGMQFGGSLGGAVLTESIFSIPGIGKLMVEAIRNRDYPMVQGGVLFIAIAACVMNLLVDILYAYIDPRIKSQYGSVGKVKKGKKGVRANG